MVECLTRDKGLLIQASPATLCCVLEQDTHSLLSTVSTQEDLVDMTERMLIGT